MNAYFFMLGKTAFLELEEALKLFSPGSCSGFFSGGDKMGRNDK